MATEIVVISRDFPSLQLGVSIEGYCRQGWVVVSIQPYRWRAEPGFGYQMDYPGQTVTDYMVVFHRRQKVTT